MIRQLTRQEQLEYLIPFLEKEIRQYQKELFTAMKELAELKGESMEENTTTMALLTNLRGAITYNDSQEMINYWAIKLVERLYVDNPETTFEDMLKEFGYKEIEKKKVK